MRSTNAKIMAVAALMAFYTAFSGCEKDDSSSSKPQPSSQGSLVDSCNNISGSATDTSILGWPQPHYESYSILAPASYITKPTSLPSSDNTMNLHTYYVSRATKPNQTGSTNGITVTETKIRNNQEVLVRETKFITRNTFPAPKDSNILHKGKGNRVNVEIEKVIMIKYDENSTPDTTYYDLDKISQKRQLQFKKEHNKWDKFD